MNIWFDVSLPTPHHHVTLGIIPFPLHAASSCGLSCRAAKFLMWQLGASDTLKQKLQVLLGLRLGMNVGSFLLNSVS